MFFKIILANTIDVPSGMSLGIAPLVGDQYILSQHGIPGYYNQYHSLMSSEDHLQMLQSELPDMVKYITIKTHTKMYIISYYFL